MSAYVCKPRLGRLRQEFEASLGYIVLGPRIDSLDYSVKPCLKKRKEKRRKERKRKEKRQIPRLLFVEKIPHFDFEEPTFFSPFKEPTL